MRPETRPYHAPHYDLGPTPAGARVTLAPVAADEAARLGDAFAAMDPWAAYRAQAHTLAVFFSGHDADCSRHAIRIDGMLAGAVVIREPWLHGPYLQFLGLLPGREGAGIGGAVLAWMAQEAPAGARNLWLCVSVINTRARAFYERHGFALVADLPALAADHMDELLLRRRLAPGGARSS